jgi:predicted enzyme related to lactoylglutathione lyase
MTGSAITIKGIDVSGYMVKEAPRAIAFYRDVLGMQPTRLYADDRGAEFDLADGTTFCLWGGGGKVMPFQPSNGVLFAVDDLESAIAILRERGVPIVMQIETPNCYMAGVNDTEGNLAILHQRKSAV